MRILLDMDEVLADFVGGVARKWNLRPADLYAHWTPGVWDVIPPLSRALGLERTMSEAEFWAAINGSEAFWLGLRATPYAMDVLRVVKGYARDDWYVVSAPSRCPYSYAAKAAWLYPKVGVPSSRLVLTGNKHLLVNSSTVLIDDREESVEKFVAAGGMGIVFPRLHNSKYEHRTSAVDYLVAELEKLGGHFVPSSAAHVNTKQTNSYGKCKHGLLYSLHCQACEEGD